MDLLEPRQILDGSFAAHKQAEIETMTTKFVHKQLQQHSNIDSRTYLSQLTIQLTIIILDIIFEEA